MAVNVNGVLSLGLRLLVSALRSSMQPSSGTGRASWSCCGRCPCEYTPSLRGRRLASQASELGVPPCPTRGLSFTMLFRHWFSHRGFLMTHSLMAPFASPLPCVLRSAQPLSYHLVPFLCPQRWRPLADNRHAEGRDHI